MAVHWRHLANTAERSVRGGDVDLSKYFDKLLFFSLLLLLLFFLVFHPDSEKVAVNKNQNKNSPERLLLLTLPA